MRANVLLAETRTPDGAALTLVRQSGRLQVQVNGIILMSSHVHGSEEAMAHISCAPLHDKVRATVLKYQNTGVRIEDDYVITDKGLERISLVPREMDEIEALMKRRRVITP